MAADLPVMDVTDGVVLKPTIGGGANVRDALGLSLAVADFCTVGSLGREFDLGFFAIAPQVTRMKGFRPGSVGPQDVDLAESYLQTARVRLDIAAVSHLVVNIFSTMKERDDDDAAHLFEMIASIMDRAPAPDQSGDIDQ